PNASVGVRQYDRCMRWLTCSHAVDSTNAIDLKRIRMNDFVTDSPAFASVGDATGTLFMWRGNGIVLFGTEEDGRWVLARGWIEGEHLQHVRRWSFAAPIPFSGQVRRLVQEATGDTAQAEREGMRALGWTE